MRKKKFLLALACAFLLSASVGATAALAAEGTQWETSQSGVTISGTATVTNVTGTADEAVKLTQKEAVNLHAGAYVEFIIQKATDTTIDADARKTGSNYILFTAKTSAGVGVQFRIYARYSQNATAFPNKMEVDVFYLDPSITAGTDSEAGRKYLESFETYQRIEDTRHSIDVHKENGMWFFAFDGLTAIPVPELNDVDLSGATLTFEYYSKENAPKFKLYTAKAGIHKNYIENNLLQFGSDQIEKLADDTVRYKIADQRAAQYPGQEIRYREHLISATGYDVTKPINISYSYDVSNASAVWYAVGLGRPDVLNSINRSKYDVFGADPSKSIESYSDSIAAKNDGIMFQTTTGLAQPTYSEQNNRKETYTTNSASKPYEGRENMDTITFIVKENGTDMYHNGKLIFENLVTKLSDFEESGYMAYPYFHFFEDNANTSKGNTIVVNGFNVATLTDEDPSYKITGGTNTDLVVGLDNLANGDITLLEPDGEGGMTAVDSSLYTYDAASKKLTVKYAWFDGREYQVYKLYARNNDGSAEISVRFSDPELKTEPPTVGKDSYFWKTGSGTEDLVIEVDIHNGIWVGCQGGGLMKNNYTYTPGENGSTVGTIAIKKEFLNNKKAGTFTFTVKTKNEENEEFTCQFKITVGESEDQVPDGGGDGDSGGETDNPDENKKKGCGSSAAAVPVAGAVLAAGIILAVKKR